MGDILVYVQIKEDLVVVIKRTKENKVVVREKVEEKRDEKKVNGYMEIFEACEEE
jgi:hypothetical protein